MGNNTSIRFKVTREEEARLVTGYQWPFGAIERGDGCWEVSSEHRRFAWCKSNLLIVSPPVRQTPFDGQIIDHLNRIPYVPQEFRETVYYNDEQTRPDGFYFNRHTRRHYVDKRRDDIDDIRAEYLSPQAIETYMANEQKINALFQQRTHFFTVKPPERVLGRACLVADFDAQKLAGWKINQVTLILEAFYDMTSAGCFEKGMPHATMYRRTQFEIATHGINCAFARVRDVISNEGNSIENKIKKGKPFELPEVRQYRNY